MSSLGLDFAANELSQDDGTNRRRKLPRDCATLRASATSRWLVAARLSSLQTVCFLVVKSDNVHIDYHCIHSKYKQAVFLKFML